MENANWAEQLESFDDDKDQKGIAEKAHAELQTGSPTSKQDLERKPPSPAEIEQADKAMVETWGKLKNSSPADKDAATTYRKALDEVLRLRLEQAGPVAVAHAKQTINIGEGKEPTRAQKVALLEIVEPLFSSSLQSVANVYTLIGGENNDDRIFDLAARLQAKDELIAETEKTAGNPLSADEKKAVQVELTTEEQKLLNQAISHNKQLQQIFPSVGANAMTKQAMTDQQYEEIAGRLTMNLDEVKTLHDRYFAACKDQGAAGNTDENNGQSSILPYAIGGGLGIGGLLAATVYGARKLANRGRNGSGDSKPPGPDGGKPPAPTEDKPAVDRVADAENKDKVAGAKDKAPAVKDGGTPASGGSKEKDPEGKDGGGGPKDKGTEVKDGGTPAGGGRSTSFADHLRVLQIMADPATISELSQRAKELAGTNNPGPTEIGLAIGELQQRFELNLNEPVLVALATRINSALGTTETAPTGSSTASTSTPAKGTETGTGAGEGTGAAKGNEGAPAASGGNRPARASSTGEPAKGKTKAKTTEPPQEPPVEPTKGKTKAKTTEPPQEPPVEPTKGKTKAKTTEPPIEPAQPGPTGDPAPGVLTPEALSAELTAHRSDLAKLEEIVRGQLVLRVAERTKDLTSVRGFDGIVADEHDRFKESLPDDFRTVGKRVAMDLVQKAIKTSGQPTAVFFDAARQATPLKGSSPNPGVAPGGPGTGPGRPGPTKPDRRDQTGPGRRDQTGPGRRDQTGPGRRDPAPSLDNSAVYGALCPN